MVTLVEGLKRTWIAEIGNSIPQLRGRFTAPAFHFAPLGTLPSISTLQYSSASHKLRTWRQAHILPECGVSCRAQKQQDGISETENPIPETEGEESTVSWIESFIVLSHYSLCTFFEHAVGYYLQCEDESWITLQHFGFQNLEKKFLVLSHSFIVHLL
jgi:hypothetical protein